MSGAVLLLAGEVMATLKVEDLTVRISTNKKSQTTTIVAYRKGGFKRAYKAILPMCVDEKCRLARVHTRPDGRWYKMNTLHHPNNVDNLVKKIIKSYAFS